MTYRRGAPVAGPVQLISTFLCFVLLVTVPLHASSFPKGIKYLGGPGSPDHKQVKNSWDSSLSITDKEITFSYRKNLLPSEKFPITSVKRITYGQATTRRVAQWIALGVLLSPVALLGIFHKSRQHRVLIEWTDAQQRDLGMLIQIDKKQFVGVLNDLAFQTKHPIYADAEDKSWLFKQGVKAELDMAPKDTAEKN